MEESLGFVGITGVLPHGTETAGDLKNATLSLQLLNSLSAAEASVFWLTSIKTLVEGGNLQAPPVCLCRRFMEQQKWPSQVTLSKDRAQLQWLQPKPSPPETTALLYKQGPCCIHERTKELHNSLRT